MTSPQIRRARRKLGFEAIGGYLGHPVSLAIHHDRLDRYWVRPVKATGGLAPAVPLPLLPGQSIPPVYNWPVRIGQDRTGQAVILGVDSDAQLALGLPALATNPLDPAARYTPKELLTELLCVPDARTGYARVYPGKVVFGDQAVDFAGDALEILAAYGPTSGNHRYVGIFLTPVGALEAQASTAQANTSALDVTDVQECLDAATAGSLLIRTYKVDGDDTELRGSIEESPDWRNLWAPISQGILAYGEMGGFQISETVTVSAADTWYELTAGLSGGEQLLCTFQNDHEIEVGVTGKYEVNWSMSLAATGAGLELMGCVGVNGTEVEKTANHDTVSNANAFVTVAGSGILDLAAGDVVSMFVLNESGTQDIAIEHVTCTLQCLRPVQTGLIADAADVTYTPAVLADWDGGVDPGNQDDANDQLASRAATLEDSALLVVTNNSGSAASAGDAGLVQKATGGGLEYVTTTTAGKIGDFVIVVSGGANGASIKVTQSGNHTLNYAGTAPNAGEYLILSTTAGQVAAQAYPSPAVLAVATANGSGGTVASQLLTRRTLIQLTSEALVYRVDNFDGTGFVSTISGTPSGNTLVYGTVTGGAENAIVPTTTDQLGKLVLHNTTRSESLLIDSVDTGTNTIAFTASVPGSWANLDTITVQSQTNSDTVGGFPFVDIDLSSSENTDIPERAVGLVVQITTRDTSAVGQRVLLHPYEAGAGSKRTGPNTLSTSAFTVGIFQVPLVNQALCLLVEANGSGTQLIDVRLQGYLLATP